MRVNYFRKYLMRDDILVEIEATTLIKYDDS
jgi:hypothetical protein